MFGAWAGWYIARDVSPYNSSRGKLNLVLDLVLVLHDRTQSNEVLDIRF